MHVPGDYDHHCAHEGCDKTVNNHYWARQRAQAEGWFTQRDQTYWCPEHVSEWVPEWRAKKAREKESKLEA